MTGAGARGLWPGRGCFWMRRSRLRAPAMPMCGVSRAGTAQLAGRRSCRWWTRRNSRAIAAIPKAPDAVVLLNNNGLHVELVFDRTHPIGSRDQAGWPMCGWKARVRDHGLRRFGRLRRCRGQGAGLFQLAGPDEGRSGGEFDKGGKTMTRTLNADRTYTAPDGSDA